MAQRPADLTPLASPRHFFGAELRYWRLRRGLSLAQLGRAVYVSADLIGKVEKARRWPSAAVVDDCEAVLDSGGFLPRLYILAARERRASSAPARADDATSATPTAVVVVVPMDDAVELSGMLGQAGVRLSALSAVRR